MIDSEKINETKNLKESYGTLSEEELKKTSILLSRVFKKNLKIQWKKEFSPSFLDWLYNKNPNGKAITYNVFDNENIIAHFSLVPITITYNKKNFKSALSVLTAVDEKYRGLYLFYRIANKTFELAKSMGFKFIIGVANDISAELFVKSFQFKSISPLEVKVGLNAFQKKNYAFPNFKIFWNNETLSWRLNNPRFKYQIYESKKEFKIYNNNYKIFNIDMGSFSKEEYSFLIDHKNKANFNFLPFSIWIGLDDYSTKKLFSFNLPNFLKPSALNFIIKDLTSEKIEIEKKDIKFNLIDFDIF